MRGSRRGRVTGRVVEGGRLVEVHVASARGRRLTAGMIVRVCEVRKWNGERLHDFDFDFDFDFETDSSFVLIYNENECS
jgi:hypothetical protein